MKIKGKYIIGLLLPITVIFAVLAACNYQILTTAPKLVPPPDQSALSTLKLFTTISLSLAIIGIVFATIGVISGLNNVKKPIDEVVKLLEGQAETKDFSPIVITPTRKKFFARRDELGDLIRAYRASETIIRETIQDTKDMILLVAEHSDNLMANAEKVSENSNSIALTAEEIAKGATEQANNVESGVAEMNKMSSALEENTELVHNLEKNAKTVNTKKNEGLKSVKTLVETTNENKEASKQISEILETTSRSISEIAQATEMITQISDQTNLLALNAAIEAARAGEAGRGFTVVAEEIRQLAENSSKFAEEINTTVEDLTNRFKSVVENVKKSEELAEIQSQNVHITNGIFEEISDSIAETTESITHILKIQEGIEKQREHMIDIMQNLSAISEENAASTEEVSATIGDQARMIEEIADLGRELATQSRKSEDAINQFVLVDENYVEVDT